MNTTVTPAEWLQNLQDDLQPSWATANSIQQRLFLRIFTILLILSAFPDIEIHDIYP